MRPQDQQLHRIRCSAKSLHQMRNSCAHKELQFHGVEDGSRELHRSWGWTFHSILRTVTHY